MIIKERLLERIRKLGNGVDEADAGLTESAVEIQSVNNHLQKLLNTRQGSAQIAEDYGVPDITNVPGEGLTESALRIERTISKIIRKYEPRLSGVRLKVEPRETDMLIMRFRLEAVLAGSPDVPIVFETVVTPNGDIQVSRR
ncbi:MAG: type VI secretion system baseplate subunit TssE [Desulfobulbaceae bacterium]|nr:type VI secretion system baseplate subunit TssE [Desulfobulbaceae bacterium]MCK5544672.1 type VI secretion system baseplate subunit TssE [Desulfobulbaceae bacterium]